jgi:hypothetical protein
MPIELESLKWLIIHALYKSVLPLCTLYNSGEKGTLPPMLALALCSVMHFLIRSTQTSTTIPPHNL